MVGRLAGKTALVTGASRGLGKSVALGFAAEGANVVVNFLREEAAAQETAAAVAQLGCQAIVVQADVSRRNEVKLLIHESIDAFGPIDILVNNAGVNHRTDFADVTDEEWDWVLQTNLKGPFICSQEIFPHMVANKGGRIINMASVAGQYYGPRTVHYAVSKSGLISLTKVLARYGAPHNILINAIAPGLILTDQTREEFESGAADTVLEMTLLKRAGTPEDVVQAAVYLADSRQNYMTGQVLAVSGGAYLG